MSNMSAPLRASTSSTARAPAMPLPITTNFRLPMAYSQGRWQEREEASDFHQADVEHDRAGHALGRREKDLQLGFRKQVLDHGERHMEDSLGADREVAHGSAVLGQDQINQLVQRVAGAEVDQLGALVGWYGV